MATPSVQELQQKITELTEQNATLTTDLAAANQKATDLEAKLSAESAKVTDLEAKLTAETAKVTAAEAKTAEVQGKLTKAEGEITTLKAEKKTAEEIGASFGGAPGKKADDADKGANAGGGDLIEQLNAITNPVERTAFYDKHEKEIRAQAAAKMSRR